MGRPSEIGIFLTPLHDHVALAFRVKLQADGVTADAKPLVWATESRRQPVSATRQIEGVAMPMQHRQLTWQTLGAGLVGVAAQINGKETDFAYALGGILRMAIGIDACASGMGKKLRTKTDPEYRKSCRETPFQ